MRLLKLVVIFTSFLMTFGEKARFDKYRVYSINIENEKHLEALQELENNQDGLTFIEAPTVIGTDAQIIVPPHKFADISDLFQMYDMKTEIKSNNLQRFVNNIF